MLSAFAVLPFLWYPISGCKFVEQHPNKKKDEEKMGALYMISRAISIGIIIGFLGGGVKMAVKKNYSEREILKIRKFVDKAAFVLKYMTFLLLCLGLVWCVYFLILGAIAPGKAEYANNMSELIVAVLTVISIVFAFVEFLRRTDDKDDKDGKKD